MRCHALDGTGGLAARRIARVVLLLLGFTAWCSSESALAAGEHDMKQGMPGTHAAGQTTPFARLMQDAMTVMDEGMRLAPMTGDADHDFAAMMIPHHQGAIDMAKAELLYGKNPVLRRLAQEIIVTQNSEIAVMQRELQQPAAGGSP